MVIRRSEHWVSWLLLVISLAGLAVASAFFLRQNNLNMVKLRDELAQADKSGKVEVVNQAARKLQRYVAGHMNTTTGRVALQTLYNQAAQKALEEAKPAEVDSSGYNLAANACRSQLTSYGYQSWASCVANRVGIRQTTELAGATMPDPDLYYVEYAPARWSPDFAGITLVLLIVNAIILTVKLVSMIVGAIRQRLRRSTLANSS